MSRKDNKSEAPELQAARMYRNAFLDKLLDVLELKNDAALAKAMLIAPPVISKFRNANLPFGSDYIIIAHELTGWPVHQIKDALDLTTVQERITVEKALGTYIEPLKLRKTEVAHHPV